MGFWGMSQTGKDAQGKLNELPNWYFDQMKNWWGQANDYLPQAQGLQDEALTEYRRRMGQGFGSVQDIRGMGQEIMPGVDEAIGNRQDRTNRLRGAAQGIPSAGQVRGNLDSITDEYGGSITGAYDTAEQDIGGTYGGLKRRADATGKDIVGSIDDSYGAADRNSTNIYNESRGNVGSTYGNIGRSIDSAYSDVDAGTGAAFGEAQSNLDKLNPNGEFRAARVGRSFAPALSSTAQRLRRAGIDPASLEGNAALQEVEGRRARAMDDSYADENQRFVSQKNALTLDKLDRDTASKIQRMQSATGAERERLAAELGLSGRQSDNQINLALGKGKAFQNEAGRQLSTEIGLDQSRLGASLDNLNTTQDRSRDYYNQRRANVGAERDMGLQDFQVQAGLEDRANADDMIGFDLRNQQYQQGVNQRGRDLDVTGQAADRINQAGNQAWSRATQAGQMGGQFGNQAQQGYGQTFQRESANAGWGKKLLLGAAAMGANALLPGSGGIITNAFGGGGMPQTGFGGAYGGGGGYGGFGTPPFLKNKGAASLPLKQGSPMNPYGGIMPPSFGSGNYGNVAGAIANKQGTYSAGTPDDQKWTMY